MLDLAIPSDTPLFRAHLHTLAHTTSLLAKTCKAALSTAAEVRSCLEALRKAEGRFMDDLERLDRVLSTGDTRTDLEAKPGPSEWSAGRELDVPSSASTPTTIVPGLTEAEAESPIRILATQLVAQRTLEMERMDQMVLSRLRGTRDGLKVRGVVGGSGTAGSGEAVALGSFEVSNLELANELVDGLSCAFVANGRT
jgi:hypothetical protein